jgi:hemolysin activation/secretion protein
MSNKPFLVLAIALLMSRGAMAAEAGAPNAGGQIQLIPPAPALERALPEIRIEESTDPARPAPDDTRILVRSLQVTGQSAFSEDELIAATGFVPGSELTLTELRIMASRIADHYHRNGYFVAQAYLPPQEIRDGVVTIRVLEGRYGEIILDNQSALSDARARRLLDRPSAGDAITIAPLERRLLLLSDLPGVDVRSTLTPGAEVGESDLIVELTPGRRVTGSVEVDNAGNYYTGRARAGASVNFNNLVGIGDVASLRVLTSGSGMQYGRAAYQIPLGNATVGAAYSAMDYELGKDLAVLDAHGTARIASLYGSYPLIRSRNTNLYALAGFDSMRFVDRVDAFDTVTRKTNRVGNLGLAGSHRDGSGVTSFGVTAYSGEIDIITPEALAIDDATARTQGSYRKLTFDLGRLQSLTDTTSLLARVGGQVASKNLDSSEKMPLGGPYGVRAYPVGEAYSDEAYIATIELRQLLVNASSRVPGQIHAIGFYDVGRGTLNKNPWTDEDNRRTLSGAGVGLNWTDARSFSVNLAYAHKLGSERATAAPDRSGQFWLQGVRYF